MNTDQNQSNQTPQRRRPVARPTLPKKVSVAEEKTETAAPTVTESVTETVRNEPAPENSASENSFQKSAAVESAAPEIPEISDHKQDDLSEESFEVSQQDLMEILGKIRGQQDIIARRRSEMKAEENQLPVVRNTPIKAAESEKTEKTEPVRKTVSAPALPRQPERTAVNRLTEEKKTAERVGSKKVKIKNEKKRGRITVGTVIRRTLLVLLVMILFAVGTLYAVCFTIAHGPSPTVRNMLVLSAKQASATKWVPKLFLPDDLVDEIVEASKVVVVDEIDIDDYGKTDPEDEKQGDDPGEEDKKDEWADYPDGIRLEILRGATYKAYMIVVKDPAKVKVGISGNYNTARYGERIFTIAEKYGAIAAINGGEFPDDGTGTGSRPIGLTYSEGECVWNDGAKRTFMGFDNNNKLIVSENMTKAQADELGIRDAVSFQNNNVLITNADGKVQFYYTDGDNGTAQRTAIGQRADGAVLLLVTDGRTASSLGATHNDVIDIMVSYGAISAAMLDGGSSAMMYYKDYYDIYDVDKSTLDQYQLQGMVNKYKAFTNPRRIPTYFIVMK